MRVTCLSYLRPKLAKRQSRSIGTAQSGPAGAIPSVVSRGDMELYLAILAAVLVAGVLMIRDGLRLMQHLALADRLANLGVNAEDACRLAGCYFWAQPWYRRLCRKYPPARLPAEFQTMRASSQQISTDSHSGQS